MAISWLGAGSALADPKLIRAAPDWKVELLTEAPTVIEPSVVCCAPDGRIFLGNDPVDMGAPSDSASDKILCIYPNGQITTFATNLHAVFGLQYIDGKLYVHHTPKFSVFDDDHGVGTHRVDLIENDNLHPWLPSFNDHIPSNCRLAMDGYLYITTGDKGVYGAVGPDGRKLEIHGGGIYRMRPNGTELEVYCTGTRNHLDVAINSEDEMFTYDNTDDGVGWWTRVTHMVDGGYYGYPYDYKPQHPYTLWMMTDYGGGAPTGACAYNEDALPDEYHGNLFLCDWGRQQVLRLKVQRDGATYKVVSRVQDKKLDFLSLGDAPDFRPVGITVTPDGKGFYIADWAKGTWKHTNVIGRLYKVTYTGKTQETAKPDWYIPAATGLKFKATTKELVAGLGHPAESVRLVAQRRLAERGPRAERPVAALLKDFRAPAYARWSAIWTLDGIDGGKKGRKAILGALNDPDVTVQMQAARELGTRRATEAAAPLIRLLQSTNAAVRLRAATALGRIGDPSAVAPLLTALNEKDFFARYADFTALHRIGLADERAWPAIVAGFASDKQAVREGAFFATRETYAVGLVEALADMAARQNTAFSVKTNLLGLLLSLNQQRPRWQGDWWNTMPANGSPPAKSIEWAGTSVAAAAMRSAMQDPEPAIRKIGFDWIRTSKDTNVTAQLATLYEHETNEDMRAAILQNLPGTPTPAASAIVQAVLRDPSPPPALLEAAVEAAGKFPGVDWSQELLRLAGQTTNDTLLAQLTRIFGEKRVAEAIPLLGSFAAGAKPALRRPAVAALQKIGGTPAIECLASLLASQSAEIRSPAITALGDMKAKSAVPGLMKSAGAPETRDVSILALAKISDLAALDIYLDGLDSKNAAVRGKCEDALRALHQKAFPLIEAKFATNEMSPQAVIALRHIYEYDMTAKKSPLFHHKVFEIPTDAYRDFAMNHPGDPRRGQRLFHDINGMGCIRCHHIRNEGGQIGPDLTGIRSKYGHADIIESVLYPSKRILDGYQQVFFQLKGDEEISGLVRAENEQQITLVDSTGATHFLEKTNVIGRRISPVSLMPEGLQTGLSLSDFADLIAYVENPNAPPMGVDPVSRSLPKREDRAHTTKVAARTLPAPNDPFLSPNPLEPPPDSSSTDDSLDLLKPPSGVTDWPPLPPPP
jgi:putative membrane-bound dehydrogenase-like protein